MTRARRRRGGFTLVELLIALVILGIVGAALSKLIVAEGRVFGNRAAAKNARAVTRAALNFMQSELRMVDAGGGVTAATPLSITLRVPYALGVACDANDISMLPTDSAMYAQALFRGYAWRDDSTGQYTYVDPAGSVGAGTAANCTAVNITTLTGGTVLSVLPALPARAIAGSNVLLFQTITYSFGPSGLLPGRYGLFRTPVGGAAEEIAVPLDSATSQFAFFNLNTDTAQATAPPLANIRGIELRLTGQSQVIPRGSASYETSQLRTGILFANRVN
jgi:prepilin-type N-terminal cleavage/methylation domain-containing protein